MKGFDYFWVICCVWDIRLFVFIVSKETWSLVFSESLVGDGKYLGKYMKFFRFELFKLIIFFGFCYMYKNIFLDNNSIKVYRKELELFYGKIFLVCVYLYDVILR